MRCAFIVNEKNMEIRENIINHHREIFVLTRIQASYYWRIIIRRGSYEWKSEVV
jgi:hypothetical protein